MDQRIYHGALKPVDVAKALLAEFSRGNLNAQALGESKSMIVQIATRPGAESGGQTALTVTLQETPDGVLAQIGQQAWLGVAASLGWTALTALRNPMTLLGRLDDIAQDVENLQMTERVWQTIELAARAAGASQQLSERLRRIQCEYCGTANAVGAGSCLACGAPLGDSQPGTCPNCGFVITRAEPLCPNCGFNLRIA
jgi:hypothetical protein